MIQPPDLLALVVLKIGVGKAGYGFTFMSNVNSDQYHCITVAATVALEEHEYSFCEGNGTVEVCVQLIHNSHWWAPVQHCG